MAYITYETIVKHAIFQITRLMQDLLIVLSYVYINFPTYTLRQVSTKSKYVNENGESIF